MDITEVRIRKHNSEDGKLKAFASVVFDGSFVVHDMKIIEGTKGLFVAMPSRKRADGSHEDIAHPVNKEFRQRIQAALLKRYHEESESGEIVSGREY
jgi:stage V sporulation protein G